MSKGDKKENGSATGVKEKEPKARMKPTEKQILIEKNKAYIKSKIDKIKEISGIEIELSEEEIEKRASDPKMSIEKSNFFVRSDFKDRSDIEKLYHDFSDYGVNRSMLNIVYSREYMDEVHYEKDLADLTNQVVQQEALEKNELDKAILKREQNNIAQIEKHLADDKLAGSSYIKIMTEDLIELRILEDAREGKIKLKANDLTDEGMKKLVEEKRKDYKEIPKMVEESYTEQIEKYVQKHGARGKTKDKVNDLDKIFRGYQGETLNLAHGKHSLSKEEYKQVKHNMIKLYLLDGARKGEISLTNEELEPKKLEERVSKIEKDYKELDWIMKKGGTSAIRRYVNNPYNTLVEHVENVRDGIDIAEIEKAKVQSEHEEYYKQDTMEREREISEWLKKRADEMAAKFSKGKKKTDKDLAMLMVVQGMQRKVEDKKAGRAELESFLNPDLINKNAENLVKDPDFKTVSKSHLKNDYEALKSGKVFNAMVQERKKTIDKYNTELDAKRKESVNEYNLAAKKENEKYFTSSEGRLEQKFNAFNNLNSVREKEAFIEREFGFRDLRHVDRFDPVVREKLAKAQKFITSANARKLISTPPEKQKDFLRKIGGDDGYENEVIREANKVQKEKSMKVKKFNDKHKIITTKDREQQPYLGL